MVVGAPDHSLQADIVFVIEGTATNGAYINDLKTNYIIPTLECFTQGNIEERDYISENSNAYGIVVYQAADCLPHPSSDTFGPFSNASRLLNALDKLELIGGKGESHANIAEGLATALQCFEELQHKREPGIPAQKHCVLVCNSPPYLLPVMESYNFSGKTCEQLAALLSERGINLSIISPRKIPALFKLFEKAGGDLTTSQTKNYAKDPRHLVLLKGFCLKERPISPPPGALSTQAPQHQTTNISLPSPISNTDSQMANTTQQNQNLIGQTGPSGVPSSVGQGPVFRPNQNQPGMQQQQQPPHSQPMVPPMGVRPGHMGGPQFTNQPLQPPGYPGMAGRPPTRWVMPPQPRHPYIQPNAVGNTQGSALIAQLTLPPSNMNAPGVNQFGQMNNQSQINPQQQQQSNNRMTMLNNQTNPQQQTSGQTTPTHNQQSVSQANITCQQMTNSNISAASVPTAQAPVTAQSQAGAGPTANQQPMNPQIASRERHTIWHGVLEWIEKAKNPTDQQKLTRHVPCSVSASLKDGEPELKADSWPQKLIMQLMPKQLIGSIGGMYLRNSKSVLFHPQTCEALESLTKVMSTGFAGCVHFTSLPSNATCDIKVLILLYTAEKRAYLGFIPNDQAAFVDRLRKVIQQQKSNQQFGRQGQVGTVPGASGIPNAPGQQMGGQQQIQGNNPAISQPQNSQQGIMMSQTNTMAMGGGQITQNVVTSTSQPNQSGINVMGQQVNPSTMSPRMTLQGMPQQGPTNNQNQQNPNNQGMRPNMMGVPQQRPPFDHLEAARQQNLEKILQLKQTLEAAQQQEAQYKSQLEIISHMKTQQLQEALQVAQQQEMQFKLQMEMQQQQQQRQNLPQGGPQPAANQQRMMRPVTLTNNPGLRHLLQQQPQYRPQLIGMQQMSGAGPRPQQMQNTGNQNQQQQFDDVPSFDFM